MNRPSTPQGTARVQIALSMLLLPACHHRQIHRAEAPASSDASVAPAVAPSSMRPIAPPPPAVGLRPIAPPPSVAMRPIAPPVAMVPIAAPDAGVVALPFAPSIVRPLTPPVPCPLRPSRGVEHLACGIDALAQRQDERAMAECRAVERDPTMTNDPGFRAFRERLDSRLNDQLSELVLNGRCSAAQARTRHILQACHSLRPSIGDSDTCFLPNR